MSNLTKEDMEKKIARLEADLKLIIDVAHKYDWNGVENSKILYVFLDGLIEDLEHDRTALAEAIAKAATDADILRGDIPLTGPQLILLCENLATTVNHFRAQLNTPISMVLHCPNCYRQHIDEPEQECGEVYHDTSYVGSVWCGKSKDHSGGHKCDPSPEEQPWKNPPHKSHLCHSCGVIWRPAAVYTTGVAEIELGKNDTWPANPKRMMVSVSGDLHQFDNTCPTSGCVPVVNSLLSGERLRLVDILQKGAGSTFESFKCNAVHILSMEHTAFYRQFCAGYTDDKSQAGVWLFEEAYELTKHAGPEKQIVYVVAELP